MERKKDELIICEIYARNSAVFLKHSVNATTKYLAKSLANGWTGSIFVLASKSIHGSTRSPSSQGGQQSGNNDLVLAASTSPGGNFWHGKQARFQATFVALIENCFEKQGYGMAEVSYREP